MYANTAYLNKELDEVLDNTRPIAVTSCGHYKLENGYMKTERKFGRKDYQLLYIASGKAYFYLDESKRCVSKGNMVIYRPDEPQLYYYYGKDKPEICWVHFSGTDVEEILSKYGLPQKENVFLTGSSPDYEWIYRQMIQELRFGRYNYEDLLEIMLRQIFLKINRYIYEGAKRNSDIIDGIERATHYFNENYNKNISIENYAEECHMSACWFIKSFKEITKMTPMQYIVSLRLTNAMNMLDNTNYSISEIAGLVGYDNALYFSRLFHKRTGMSPSEYRKRIK